jgi:hypothetical protein
MSAYDSTIERLAAIEEELRDAAYERLRAAIGEQDPDTADALAKEEKRVLQARRAIAKAISALEAL